MLKTEIIYICFWYTQVMSQYNDEQYTTIIPTAYLTSYPRIFTDIPYSKEIFTELEHILQQKDGAVVGEELKVKKLAPEIEARYLLVNNLLRKSGVHQVLELASGLSSRGLVMSRDPEVKYAELELGQMADIKKEIVYRLIGLRDNLRIVSGNALRLSDLEKAVEYFDHGKQICVINEGLLRYFDFSEKAQVARGIHLLLEQFGGLWITPDITLKKLLETQDKMTMPGKNKMISASTGKNYHGDNSFENSEQAIKFFEDQGFSVETHQFSEVASLLVSPRELDIAEIEAEKIISHGMVFVMRVAKA
jgi:O-methyltransferase involved in polyketide biosynthesis